MYLYIYRYVHMICIYIHMIYIYMHMIYVYTHFKIPNRLGIKGTPGHYPRYQDLEENSSSNMETFEIRASAALFTDDELQENIVPRMKCSRFVEVENIWKDGEHAEKIWIWAVKIGFEP